MTEENTEEAENGSNIHHLRTQAQNLPGADEMKSDLNIITEYDKRLATAKGTYMAKCKAIREEKKEDLTEMRGRGVNTKVLLATHKTMKVLDQLTAVSENLGEDNGPVYDHYIESLQLTFGFAPVQEKSKKKKKDK